MLNNKTRPSEERRAGRAARPRDSFLTWRYRTLSNALEEQTSHLLEYCFRVSSCNTDGAHSKKQKQMGIRRWVSGFPGVARVVRAGCQRLVWESWRPG